MKVFLILLLLMNGLAFAEYSPRKLVYAQNSEALTLDPHESTDLYSNRVIFNIFDRLVERDERLEIIPGLAEKWEQIDESEEISSRIITLSN